MINIGLGINRFGDKIANAVLKTALRDAEAIALFQNNQYIIKTDYGLKQEAIASLTENATFPAANLIGPDAALYATSANALPYDWGNGIRQVRLEPASTNYWQDNALQNTTLGSGGDLGAKIYLSGWTAVNVASVQNRGALRTATLTLTCDNSGGGGAVYPRVQMQSADYASAAQTQTWTASLYYSLSAKTGANAAQLLLQERNGTSYLAGSSSNLAVGAALQRLAVSRTLSNASTNKVEMAVGINVNAAETASMSIEIGGWQLEKQSAASSLIETSGSAATRNASSFELSDVIKAVRATGGNVLAWRHNSIPVILSVDTLANGYTFDGVAAFASGYDTSALEALKWSELG